MPSVSTLRSKGATVEVIAAGEVLFMPGGQVHGWTRRFSNRIQKFTEAAAPTNKRPRWGHYGKPLKSTIVSKPPRFRKTPGGARCYAAVGSSAPHAYYVDQGTGIYAGRGPYEAKVLPPWQRSSPSLYEHTFKVPTGSYENDHGERVTEWEEVGTITVRGQKGQEFFAKGLNRAFESMLRRSHQIPTDPKVARALADWPRGLEGFGGNTPADAAFVAQLTEWRAWRDAAWSSGKMLGQGYVRERYRREFRDVQRTIEKARKAEIRLEVRRKKTRERVAAWRARKKDEAHAARQAEDARRIRAQRLAQQKADLAKTRRKNARAEEVRKRAVAIAAERAELLSDAQAKYRASGYFVAVSARMKHDGVYSYRLDLRKGGSKSHTFWIPSDYQT